MEMNDNRLLDPIWNFIIEHEDLKYFCSHMLFGSLLACGSFIGICLYFTIFYDLPRNMSTKIQKDLWPTTSDMLEAAVPQILIYFVANYLSWFMFDVRIDLPDRPPTLLQLTRDLVINFLIGDFLIYWNHRIMHTIPFLRHHIHSVHHKYTTVFSWAGGWVHPLEDLLVVGTQTVGPLWLVPCHPFSFWVFLIFWVVFLVEEHSGHDVWWSPHKYIPFGMGGGGAPHDIHHSPLTTKNFGFVFCIWDQLFGTYVPPPGESQDHGKNDKSYNIIRCLWVMTVVGLLILVNEEPLLDQVLGWVLIPIVVLSIAVVPGLYEVMGTFFALWVSLVERSKQITFVLFFMTMAVCSGALCNFRVLKGMFVEMPGEKQNPLQAIGLNIGSGTVRAVNWITSNVFLFTFIHLISCQPRFGDESRKFYEYLGIITKFRFISPLEWFICFGCFFYITTYFGIAIVHDSRLVNNANAPSLKEALLSLREVWLVYIPSLVFLMVVLDSLVTITVTGLLLNITGMYLYTSLLHKRSKIVASKQK